MSETSIPEEYENDPIYLGEQQHLAETYTTLCDMEDEVSARMHKTALEASEDKNNAADEIASNFASDQEAQETYVEYASLNSVIDSYNQKQSIDREKLTSIQILKRQPYFAKLELEYKPGAPAKELYIGNAGLSDENYRRMVVDWRSPVAEVYYNQSNGATSYEANGRTINVNLKTRRQFDIEADTLRGYFDTTVAIEDKLLLASLQRKRSDRMRDITATIQKEQNTVVRHDDVNVLLVNGIAGSGKTSVLLQRIAYLFYQNRETLNPEDVYLITPNPVFRTYIDAVLPNMGEKNPRIITFAEFAASFVPQGRTFDSTEASLETLAHIDEALASFEFHPKDFKDIKCAGTMLIGAQQLAKLCDKYKKFPAGPRRIIMMREELERRLDSRLNQMAATEAIHDEIASLPINDQLRLFSSPFNPQNDEEAHDLSLIYLKEKYAEALDTVRGDHWLRIDRIAKRLCGIEELSLTEWLYFKLAITGQAMPDARYVMVDEVQDYTPAQLTILAKYFRRAHFLLLGDQNQAIFEASSTFDEVASVFEGAFGQVNRCSLMTSYRSTPAITNLFARLLPENERLQVSSVQRDDVEPTIMPCHGEGDWRQALSAAMTKASQAEEGLTAIIAATEEEAAALWESIEGTPAAQNVRLVDNSATLPDHGTIVIALPLAKGLEFDNVILADASTAVYPETELNRRRLYTAISRATATVTILANGELTPLLTE